MMELNIKQKELLSLNIISLALLTLADFFFERSIILNLFFFVPFLTYAILTTTTAQHFFAVKKQWRIPILILGVLSLRFLQTSLFFLFSSFGYASKIYGIVAIIAVLICYFFCYFKNAKRNLVK